MIATMSEDFDSHEYILKLAQANQRAYVQELARFDGDNPFGQLHAQLSAAIGETKLVENIGLQTSENIWRKPNKNAKWRKIANPV